MPIPTWFVAALRFIGVNGVKYGPLVWTWLSANPEVRETIERMVKRLTASTGQDPDEMRKTLQAMREQVEYLRNSADDDFERRRAAAWSTSLIRLEHAVEMLRGGAARADVKRLRSSIDALRAQILDAFLIEQVEDAGGPSAIEAPGSTPTEP
ncbi:hypothetical protein [Agrococcus beijingensis]|uniref:hypothetical protein n=1 Tax=Agrococcus beijingensis TaxID=3068634 RepID=UPI0027409707|nr:hypothetical protein [Agrococcus sp. REN33]